MDHAFLTKRIRFAIAATTLCLIVSVAAPAGAQQSAWIGQIPADNSTSVPCFVCTGVQWSDSGANGYGFPFDGILTRYQIRVGTTPTGAETVRLRTFHLGAPYKAMIAADGATQLITGTGSLTEDFLDRVPAASGDRLGARFQTSGALITNTSWRFGSGSGSDRAAYDTDDPINPGSSNDFGVSSGSPFAGVRVNIKALLEPDDDHDMYGDESQDLCGGDPEHFAAPCSGTALGSALAPSTLGGTIPSCTGFACIVLQRKIGGVEQSAPFDGVIVRWRMRPLAALTTKIRVLRLGSPGTWDVVRSGDATPVPFDATRMFTIYTFPARVPISAGDYVGFSKPLGVSLGLGGVSGGNQMHELGEVADGASVPFDPTPAGTQSAFGVDIEPDADHDGYGDLTQDRCTTDSTIQTACLLPPISAAPVITQFKTLFKRFRVKPNGAIVSKRAHPGTTISLNISEPANVVFTVTKLFRGKITNGVCKKAGRSNRKGRRCTKTIVVHSFSRAAVTGVNAYPYSARYRDDKGNIGHLRAGPYRLSATATDASGNVGTAEFLSFKIRH